MVSRRLQWRCGRGGGFGRVYCPSVPSPTHALHITGRTGHVPRTEPRSVRLFQPTQHPDAAAQAGPQGDPTPGLPHLEPSPGFLQTHGVILGHSGDWYDELWAN